MQRDENWPALKCEPPLFACFYLSIKYSKNDLELKNPNRRRYAFINRFIIVDMNSPRKRNLLNVPTHIIELSIREMAQRNDTSLQTLVLLIFQALQEFKLHAQAEAEK